MCTSRYLLPLYSILWFSVTWKVIFSKVKFIFTTYFNIPCLYEFTTIYIYTFFRCLWTVFGHVDDQIFILFYFLRKITKYDLGCGIVRNTDYFFLVRTNAWPENKNVIFHNLDYIWTFFSFLGRVSENSDAENI